MRIQKDLIYGNGQTERQRLDVVLPENEPQAFLLYFHGGGLEGGSKEDASFLHSLSDQGIALILPNYRLYPAARYPEFIVDAALASSWAVKYRDSRHPGKKLYLAGSSAGAYLAMMLCFDGQYLAAHGIIPNAFAGCLFDAGQPTVHFNVLKEAGMHPMSMVVDERAPMFHVREEQNYPPMLFLCAQNDIPERYEQTQLMLSVLKNLGHGEKAAFRLMEGYGHCEYDDQPVFRELVLRFMGIYIS